MRVVRLRSDLPMIQAQTMIGVSALGQDDVKVEHSYQSLFHFRVHRDWVEVHFAFTRFVIVCLNMD